MKPRLGVNIDHIATVRQARGESYPSIRRASDISLENGADQITIHLREDRRHIQDSDVFEVRESTKHFNKLFNFEMATSQDVIDIALKAKPDWICLVPEKREERTTEGGLDLSQEKVFEKIKRTIGETKSSIDGLRVSLFLEANPNTIELASQLDIDAIEIHTGDYAKAFLEQIDRSTFIKDFKTASELMDSQQIHCHAGHGLTHNMLPELLDLKIFEEYNIGHWIISESLFLGLDQVISSMRKLIDQY